MRKVLPIILLVFLLVSCCTSHKAEAPAVEPVIEFPDLTESMTLLFDAMPDDENEISLQDPIVYYWHIALNSMEFEKAAERWREFSGKEESWILETAATYPVDLEPSYSLVFALRPVDVYMEPEAALIKFHVDHFADFTTSYMNWKQYGLSLADYIRALAEA